MIVNIATIHVINLFHKDSHNVSIAIALIKEWRQIVSRPLKDSERGVTLIEISIVLVIIGVLTGGIFVGRTLIKQAELRSAVADVERFKTAINTFYGKYNALPGDMSDATSYWGAANADATICKTTQGTGTQTCNGNSDRTITTNDSGVSYSETWRVWQHLANAGMIEGKYSGVAGSGSVINAVIGVNVPASKISGGGYHLRWFGTLSGNTIWFDGKYNHVIYLGAQGSYYETAYPLLSPAEALDIDNKTDDGLPSYGNIRTFKNANPISLSPNCATTNVSSTTAYATNLTGPQCMLVFITGF